MKECNRICEWNNPSNGCVKPGTVDCKMPNLFKGAKPQTNADRIRSMSDEELAKLIAENAYTGACNDFGIPHQVQCCHNCEKCDAIINWLKQPAE